MKVDAPGLVAAAQRLTTAVTDLGAAAGAAHPPLAPDAASVGAAARLTGAGAELAAAVGAHVAALVASAQALTGAALSYVDVDERNATAIARLDPAAAGGAAAAVAPAPPAPPVPPDARAPMPPPIEVVPEVIAAALHSGAPGAGESYIDAWSAFALAARDGAGIVRATAAELPAWLEGPASTAAVRGHLLGFADGLDAYARRAELLVGQARAYATNLVHATEQVPTVQQLATARRNVAAIASANARSGGALAGALATATGELNRLSQQAVNGNQVYHRANDAATAGGDPGTGGQRGRQGSGDPGADPAGDGPGPADGGAPEASGELAGLVPQVLPAVLGAAGGLVGGALGAVTKAPAALMRAGTQALGSATQGLSGLGQPKTDAPGKGGGGEPHPGGGEGPAGGGEAPTVPAGGDGVPELSVAPSTGAPPTPAIAPAGATEGPAVVTPPAGGSPGGMAPMGMPLGGPVGAPGGGGGAGKEETGRRRKVETRDIPHTEDVTGRVDTNRLSAAASANHYRDRSTQGPAGDDPPDSGAPVVRRLVTRRPEEPS